MYKYLCICIFRCQFKSAEGPRETFKMPKNIGDPYLSAFKYIKTAIPKALLKQGTHFHMHDILTYLYIHYILNISPSI